MDKEQLNKMEEEEKEIIKRFKNKELEDDKSLDLSEVHEYLIEKLEKDYEVPNIKEFKKYNIGTLYKIHDALKNDEPKILIKYGIKKKK